VEKDGGLSTNAKAGIGLGVSIPVLAVLFLLCRIWMKTNVKNHPKNAVGVGQEVELGDRNVNAEGHPPDYSSVVETEVGSLSSGKTAVRPIEAQGRDPHDLEHV
jgi:hypothetical protein